VLVVTLEAMKIFADNGGEVIPANQFLQRLQSRFDCRLDVLVGSARYADFMIQI
jgi:hypothetical protein